MTVCCWRFAFMNKRMSEFWVGGTWEHLKCHIMIQRYRKKRKEKPFGYNVCGIFLLLFQMLWCKVVNSTATDLFTPPRCLFGNCATLSKVPLTCYCANSSSILFSFVILISIWNCLFIARLLYWNVSFRGQGILLFSSSGYL